MHARTRAEAVRSGREGGDDFGDPAIYTSYYLSLSLSIYVYIYI